MTYKKDFEDAKTDFINLKPFNRIHLMGIELEGAWHELDKDVRTYYKEDSSVNIEGCGRCECCEGNCGCDVHNCFCSDLENNDSCSCCRQRCGCYQEHRDEHDCEGNDGRFRWVGELASPTFKDYQECQKWTDLNYPDECNSSCGIHIHLSFYLVGDYSRLMEQKFYRFFEKKMLEFGNINHLKPDSQFYKRLAGQNSFCIKTYTPDLNLKGGGNRYQQLNVCFYSHGTLEIRMLPCFKDKKFAIRAISYIHKLFNDYLNNHPIQKPKRYKVLKLKQKIEVEI